MAQKFHATMPSLAQTGPGYQLLGVFHSLPGELGREVVGPLGLQQQGAREPDLSLENITFFSLISTPVLKLIDIFQPLGLHLAGEEVLAGHLPCGHGHLLHTVFLYCSHVASANPGSLSFSFLAVMIGWSKRMASWPGGCTGRSWTSSHFQASAQSRVSLECFWRKSSWIMIFFRGTLAFQNP